MSCNEDSKIWLVLQSPRRSTKFCHPVPLQGQHCTTSEGSTSFSALLLVGKPFFSSYCKYSTGPPQNRWRIATSTGLVPSPSLCQDAASDPTGQQPAPGEAAPHRPHSRSDGSSTSAARAKRLRRATRYRLLPTAHAHPLRLHWSRVRCSSRKLRAGRRRYCACGGVLPSG